MPSLRHTPPLLILILTACVSLPPEGPSVMSLPGRGQSFAQFRADDGMCRDYARQMISPKTPETAAVDAGVASAALATAVGAAVGAAVDGSSGAAVGAGVGLLVGSTSGVAASNASSYVLQQRYDQSYVQCMYSRGHKVPRIRTPADPLLPALCRRHRRRQVAVRPHRHRHVAHPHRHPCVSILRMAARNS